MRAPRLTRESTAPGLATNVSTDVLTEYITNNDNDVKNKKLKRHNGHNVPQNWSDDGFLGYRYDKNGQLHMCEVELLTYIRVHTDEEKIVASDPVCFAVVVDIHDDNSQSTSADIVGLKRFDMPAIDVVSQLDTEANVIEDKDQKVSTKLNDICEIYLTDELNPIVLHAKLTMMQEEQT